MIETALRQVYIMGIAQNEQERYRVLQIARSQEGALGVYDFIKVLGTDTK
jgi:osmotically-inducible protein OsmY